MFLLYSGLAQARSELNKPTFLQRGNVQCNTKPWERVNLSQENFSQECIYRKAGNYRGVLIFMIDIAVMKTSTHEH